MQKKGGSKIKEGAPPSYVALATTLQTVVLLNTNSITLRYKTNICEVKYDCWCTIIMHFSQHVFMYIYNLT